MSKEQGLKRVESHKRVNFDPKDISNEQCTVSTSLIPSVNIRSSASACNSPEAQVTVRRSKDQATVRSKQRDKKKEKKLKFFSTLMPRAKMTATITRSANRNGKFEKLLDEVGKIELEQQINSCHKRNMSTIYYKRIVEERISRLEQYILKLWNQLSEHELHSVMKNEREWKPNVEAIERILQ
ncbi:hypothetical protein DINM_000832 [Dirofilaria immitis]|nr:hypothetical protein [Dirofilaria immitis]